MQTDKLTLAENNNNIMMGNQVVNSQMNLDSKSNENMPMPIPMDGAITSRLLNTKIVRIYQGTACACVNGCKKLVFNVNTISRRDDQDRRNENELPLFYVEEEVVCQFLCIDCNPSSITFSFHDANTNALYSKSTIPQLPTKIDSCCDDTYYILKDIDNYKMSATFDKSNIRRYDTRSVYRTYDYMGQSYYKIGQPYIPKEISCCRSCLNCITCIPCCCCFSLCLCDDEKKGCDCCCCCCCCCGDTVQVYDDKRLYIDIYNMNDVPVGKFAHYYEKGCCCCKSPEDFYEVYFPPDSNEMLRLALIAQIIFLVQTRRLHYFTLLPGSHDNLDQFIN